MVLTLNLQNLRVHKELDEIFLDNFTRKVTSQDLSHMVYLEMVINEVLRSYSFIPVIQRQLEEDIEIGELYSGDYIACRWSSDPSWSGDGYKFVRSAP